MLRHPSVLIAGLVALAAPACQTADRPTADTAADRQAIEELDRRWVQAVAAGDIDFIADSIYADDGVFLPPNAPATSGDAVRGSWAQLLQLPNLDLSFEPTSIEVSDDGGMAYDIGTYSFGFDGPQGRIRDEGKYLVVWEKRNGRWQVVADMFNSDNPMPGGG